MSGLADALTANRTEIERELMRAEEELAAVQRREQELQNLIRRARIALGVEPPQSQLVNGGSQGRSRMTLHEALLEVLRSTGSRGMTARELADAVNASGLYVKRDGSQVDPGQIYARTHNYSTLFERVDGRIRSRQPA